MDTTFGRPLLPIPFREIFSYVDQRIALIPEDNERYARIVAMKEMVLAPLVQKVKEHPGHAGLIYVTDLFRQAFHDLIMPMEPWLFIKMPDYDNELGEHDIDRSDAFATLPGHFDSCRILGTEDYFLAYEYYSAPWSSRMELDELKKCMGHCCCDEGKEGAIQLGLLEQRNRVVSLWEQLWEYVHRESMEEIFETVWHSYSIVGSLVFMANNSVDTELTMLYFRSPRYVEMKEVLVPILERREFQEKMEVFSINDLSPTEIMQYGDQLFAVEPSSSSFAAMQAHGKKVLGEYRDLFVPFAESPFMAQFCTAEKAWYQAVDLLYMTLATPPGVVGINDQDALIEEYRNSIYADAGYELAEIVYDEDGRSYLGQERGETIGSDEWELIKMGFSRFESQNYMETLKVVNLFNAAVSADEESKQLADMIADRSQMIALRKARETVTVMIRGYRLNEEFLRELADDS